jgi:hypothetical protein
MNAIEIESDRRAEQQAIRRMLSRDRRPDEGTAWYFHRLGNGNLMVEGLAAWRVAALPVLGDA